MSSTRSRACRASRAPRRSTSLPSSGNNAGRSIEIDGRPNPDPANPPEVDYRAATPTFFDTMRIPILRGRGFTIADREDTEPVAIVTQALAEKYFPGADAIGRRIKLGAGSVGHGRGRLGRRHS